MPVLKANPRLFACIRNTNTGIWECCRTDRTSLPVSEVTGCDFTTFWSQREEYPSFLSDRGFSNLLWAVGYWKIYMNVPENCRFCCQHRKLHRPRVAAAASAFFFFFCQQGHSKKLNLGISSAKMSSLVHAIACYAFDIVFWQWK